MWQNDKINETEVFNRRRQKAEVLPEWHHTRKADRKRERERERRRERKRKGCA